LKPFGHIYERRQQQKIKHHPQNYHPKDMEIKRRCDDNGVTPNKIPPEQGHT
jgi:hypothetical protein